jgi:hypothetical protein
MPVSALLAAPDRERGSALLIALVAVFVMSLLGLALFDLARLEGRLAMTSLADWRAFEAAQAGLERGIAELRRGWWLDNDSPATWGNESWADAINGPTCAPGPCDAAQFRPLSLANPVVPASSGDPGGSYVVEMKLVSVAEANNPISQGAAFTYPYGQECIPDTAVPTLCANLVFLRSTGTVTGPPGFTRSRTVQALVKAYPTSPFAAAVTAGFHGLFPAEPAVDGHGIIAGTIHVRGSDTSNPAVRLGGGAALGQKNNWEDLTAAELDRLTPRQLVCPPQTNCSSGGNLVESLGAELKVYGNVVNPLVALNGRAQLGRAGNTSPYGTPSRSGKGRLDGVYAGRGCVLPCTSLFTLAGGSGINVDFNNITKPYPIRPPRGPIADASGAFPILNQAARVAGVDYGSWSTNFFYRNTTSIATDPVGGHPLLPLAAQDAHFNQFSAVARPANGGSCGLPYAGTVDMRAVWASLTDLTPPFCHAFQFVNKRGVVTAAEVCWRRTTGANLPPAQPTLEFGIPTCAAPNTPASPIMIYRVGNVAVDRAGAPDTYYYRGAAIVLAVGAVQIEETLITSCAAAPCAGQKFPEHNLLALLSTGNISVAMGNSNLSVMAYLFTEATFQARRNVHIIGSVRAGTVCLTNSSSAVCSVSGGGVPGIFHAGFPDPRRIPEELPVTSRNQGVRWVVDIVPRFWRECGPGPLPTTPTGSCGY